MFFEPPCVEPWYGSCSIYATNIRDYEGACTFVKVVHKLMYKASFTEIVGHAFEGHPANERLIASLSTFWLPLHSEPNDLKLFHYTDSKGLFGIIRSRSLWGTDARFLNDWSEINHGRLMILNMLSEEESKHGSSAVGAFLSQVATTFSSFFAPITIRVFVSSFCTRESILSQWRAYAHRGDGYALGFEISDSTTTEMFGKSESSQPNTLQAPFRRVIYCDDEKVHLIRETISHACKFFEELCGSGVFHGNPSLAPTFAAKAMTNMLGELVYCFKDKAFYEEKEWRLVRVVSGLDMSELCQFHTVGRYVVPFVASVLYDVSQESPVKTFPLRSITVGPAVDLELAKLSLTPFLDAEDAENDIELNSGEVSIVESGIPYRTL